MTIPNYQQLMLPVLNLAKDHEIRVSDAINQLEKLLGLTEEDLAKLLPSGRQSVFANRVHWAKTYLKQAGLVENTKRGHFQATQRGKEVLASGITHIDNDYLAQFDEYISFRLRGKEGEVVDENKERMAASDSKKEADETPEDQILAALNWIDASLARELVDLLLAGTPAFFEQCIVTLLVSMGYGGTHQGAGQAIGRSGDNGVDGVIDQDVLGLDRVYIQAKRYDRKQSISSSAIRDFYGSLDMHRAAKGVFVTTSTFTSSAEETARQLGKRIVLIDGDRLGRLMVRYNVGCRVEQILELKRVDEEFFG